MPARLVSTTSPSYTRGDQTYSASVHTGLGNRLPFVDAAERQTAVLRALKSGAMVKTPMGVFRSPPSEDE